MSRKAKVFLEVEVEVNRDIPNDRSLSYAEIAEYAAGGIACGVKAMVEANQRPAKLVSARYEFTISDIVYET